MDYVEALKEMMQDGADNLWRTVRATPEDRMDWRPAADARTARELIEEVVGVMPYSAELIRTRQNVDMQDGEQSKDLQELEAKHRASIEDYVAAVKEFPVEHLHDSIVLPWGKMSFMEVISYPYWNMMYHWGQISYIQTMYGDKEMY